MKLNKDTPIFSIGSCFAREIRSSLLNRGYKVLPSHPLWNSRLYYNTYSILYEFERVYAGLKTDERDICRISRRSGHLAGWQEPSRRIFKALTKESLMDLSRQLDVVMDAAIREASFFIITPGMCESFKSTLTGKIFCADPQYGNPKRVSSGWDTSVFHNVTKKENYANLMRIVSLINEYKSGATIVLTVSPVPLASSFTDWPVKKASDYAKKKLVDASRAVADAVRNVYYFPSFEYCMSVPETKRYKEKEPHRWHRIRADIVKEVVRRFERQFMV